jgi:hypothetical protein
MVNFDDVIGKTVDSVELLGDKDRILLRFQDGSDRSYGVEGDCCSTSWIEHLEMPPDVRGAVILSVDDGGEVEPWDGHVCVETQYDKDYKVRKEGCGHESLAVYNTRFHTNKGDIVMEYRNDSNGYYGGYLVD